MKLIVIKDGEGVLHKGIYTRKANQNHMYSVISTFHQTIVDSIPSQEVTEYDWLRENVGQASTAAYQKRYKGFRGDG